MVGLGMSGMVGNGLRFLDILLRLWWGCCRKGWPRAVGMFYGVGSWAFWTRYGGVGARIIGDVDGCLWFLDGVWWGGWGWLLAAGMGGGGVAASRRMANQVWGSDYYDRPSS